MTPQQIEALTLAISLVEQMRKDNETLFNLVTVYTNNVTRMIVLLEGLTQAQLATTTHSNIK